MSKPKSARARAKAQAPDTARARAPQAAATAPTAPAASAPPAEVVDVPVGYMEPTPRVDQVIEGLVLLLLAFLPLAFGGVLPFAHTALIAVAGIIAALFAVRCFIEGGAALVWSWGYVPAALLLLVVLLQVVPLPLGVIAALSPETAALWRATAVAGQAAPTTATLSLYPHGTWTDLRLLMAALTVFFVVVNVHRDRDAFRRLLAGVGLIGLVVALIGIVQVAFGANKIYWLFDSPAGRITAGPFASYSHFSEFVNLSLGCALGYLLVRAIDRSHGRPIELRDLVDLRAAQGVWLERVLAASLIVGALAIALSTSRNGLISLVFAGSVTAVAMQVTRKVEGVGWPLVGVATIAFVALLALGFDPIYTRMSDTLADPIEAYDVRAALARDTFRMATALPLVGSGFGSYWVAFPMFDTSVRGGTAANAENQYLEVLAETGFVGGAAAMALLGLVIAALVRLARSQGSRTNIAGFGLLFGVAAIGFHSVTDFGLEIPAVGVLTLVIAAAALGRASRVTTLRVPPRFVAGGVSVALAVGLGLSIAPTLRAHRAYAANLERDALHAAMTPPNFRGTPTQHQRLEYVTEVAAEALPGDVQAAFWRAMHRWTNAVAAAVDYGEPKETVTPETNPELVATAREVQAEFFALQRLAPTFGPSWSVAGQLGLMWLDDPDASRWIQRGRELAPHHPNTCLASGVERLIAGDEERGMADLERAAAVGASKGSIVNLLAWDLQRPDLAYRVAEGERWLLNALAQHLTRMADFDDLAQRVAAERDALLESEAARSGAHAGTLAELGALRERQGRPGDAIAIYHRVLAKDPESRARYDLARLLADSGEPREAIRQLRDLLGLHPDHGAGRALLQQLEQELEKR